MLALSKKGSRAGFGSQPKNGKQSGFTLVELLIGLFLSLFIVGVALTYFVSSSRTFRTHTSESVVQENARFAMELLAQSFRHAGLNSSNSFTNDMDVIVSAAICSNSESGLADGGAGSAACTRDGANDATDNNSDRVAIDFMADASDSTVNITVTGCNNHDVVVPAGDKVRLANVFWTADPATDSDDIRSLYCQTMNMDTGVAEGVAVPLIDGVDRMQVQFGVDANNDGIIERYQSFTNLGAANVEDARAIRIALLLNSGLGVDTDSNTEDEDTRSFTLLDGEEEDFTDQKFRQIYSTTVLLLNSFTLTP
jgi:type IV pilus assembly protein PilW